MKKKLAPKIKKRFVLIEIEHETFFCFHKKSYDSSKMLPFNAITDFGSGPSFIKALGKAVWVFQ